jgi:acyl carrier protein
MEDGPWLVMSRLVGVLGRPDGGAVVTHVLGRHRVLLSADALEQLLAYRLPRRAGAEASSDLIRGLLDAQILRPAGARERSWMRKAAAGAYALRSGAPESGTPVLSLGEALRVPAAREAPREEPLRLSAALAVVDLAPHGVLATHPLGQPTHITPDLWQLARSFASPRCAPSELSAAVAFLKERRLLWAAGAEERAAAALAPPSGRFRVEQPAVSRYWQFWRPFEFAEVNRPTRHVSLVVVGPCLAHQHLEILTHFGLRHGLTIAAEGDLDAATDLLASEHDAVFYHPGKFTHALTQAATLDDLHLARGILDRIRAALGAELGAMRARSARPIIAPLLARPRVTSTRPGDPMDLWLDEAYATLNAHLAHLAREHGAFHFIDELRERDLMGVGRYKDDVYNAATHNAPIVNWSVPVLKTGLQHIEPEPAGERLLPPLTAGQIEPSAVLAAGMLRLLLQLTSEMPQVGLTIEPDDLLWRGRLDHRDPGEVLHQMLTVGPENDFYAGIHEALVGLSVRGVPIWLRTASTVQSIDALMDALAPYPQLLRRQRWQGILAREGGAERLISGRSPGDRRTVLVNFADPGAWAKDGPWFPAELRWRLREYLLTAPELHGAEAWRERAADPAGKRTEANPSATPADQQRIAALLDRIVAETAGVALEAAIETEHLADLGIDSLAILQVIAAMEKTLGVSMPSWDKLENIAYNKSRLCEAFAAATSPPPPTAHLRTDHGRDPSGTAAPHSA